MALILDTGPLYASLDRRDAGHAACRRLIETTSEALVIPAPVLVEVDCWIHARLHVGVLMALLDDIVAAAYQVEELHPEGYRHIRELCDRYADAAIGFVDAAVLAVAERLKEPKLATLHHSHFGTMRPRHVEASGCCRISQGVSFQLEVRNVAADAAPLARAVTIYREGRWL